MKDNEGINSFWNVFLTIAGVAGIVNIVRAFKRPSWSELEKKEREIDILKKKVQHYQKLINGKRND